MGDAGLIAGVGPPAGSGCEASAAAALTRAQPAAADLLRLIDSSNDLIWSVDRDCALLAFNRAVQEALLSGFGRLVAIGDRPQDLLPEAEAARWMGLYRQAMAEGSLNIEMPAHHGRLLKVHLHRIDEQGEILGVSAFARDISQRKLLDEQLAAAQESQRESQERFRSTFDQAAVGMVHASFEGVWLRSNERFARIIGYPFEEVPGKNFQEITLEEDRLQGDTVMKRVLDGEEESASFDKRYVRKDGSLTWAAVTITLQRDTAGQPLHFIATIQDINARKQAEEQLAAAQDELRKSEERYRATFEQAAMGILHTSLDGCFLRCNEQFSRIVGYTQAEIQGVDFQQITYPEDRASSGAILARLLSGAAETAHFEKRYVCKDGALAWVALAISILRDSGGRPLHFIATVQDISASKIAEERLAVAQESRRLSEERYRAAFQTTLDALAINRLSDGAYLEVNRAFLHTSGFSEEELIGHTSIELNIWAEPRDRQRMLEELSQHANCRNLEAQFRRKNGEIFWGLMSASAIELEGVPCILSITRDISDAKMAEDEIRTLAFYDPLTGLPNRRLLLERLHQALNSSLRSSQKRALLFVDLDDFKMLNDTLGHQTGDLLLQEVAQRLTQCVRGADTVARLGGDEFVVMLEGLSTESDEAATQAQHVGEKILAAFAEPFQLKGRECLSTCSIGITVFGKENAETSEVLQQADIAMYQAKAAGRNTMHFFAPALQAAVSARAALEEELRQAIRNQQFLLWYQPQVTRGRVVGAEALLRWQHPRRGILGPGEFIHLAEETGLILPLGSWVLHAACVQIAAWARSRQTNRISVAVNISARQFRQPEFVAQVVAAFQSTGADPRKLKLELTESMLVENVEDVIAKMSALKEYGLRFSLDDFGTGYSSLAYLQRLPLDQLKIDRSFVNGLKDDNAQSAIAQAIVSLGKALHLPVIAEGVETEEQRSILNRLGCHVFQGYLFGRPTPIEEFLRLLTPVPTAAAAQEQLPLPIAKSDMNEGIG
jgi:diguanylate cyclase (GGDEF)-like protein/PAS domain S-box-containing protein